MSQKRQEREEGTSFDDKRLRKSHSFRSVVLDVIHLMRMQNLMNPLLEPLIRRVVKEEVDSALRKYIIGVKRYAIRSFSESIRLLIRGTLTPSFVNKIINMGHTSIFKFIVYAPWCFLDKISRNRGKDTRPSESRSLQLQFLNAISLPVFTGTRIEGEGHTSIEVALVDVLTGQAVSSGLASYAKVEIVVLEGDFDGSEEDNWTLEEFKNNIVREREGKKPLLTGDVILTLKDGIGSVGDVSFTDNSSWTRSRKFRLGARLIDDIDGLRIREARSEPFVVRDHRGELYKKHHPPTLSDEVWRLEKIGKGGALHKRLSRERINTVQDFLILLSLDPTRLRNILGTGMSAKKWEVTVEHARTCVLDKTLYLYSASTSLQKTGVVFNVVGQVLGMFSNDQYVAIDKLSDEEKANARELVISAFRDREKIVAIDESSLNMPTLSCLSNAQPSSNLLAESSYHQDSSSHNIGRSAYSQQDTSSPDFMQSLYPIGGLSNFDYYSHGVDPMEIRYDQPLSFPGQVTDSSICDTDSMARAFSANEHFKYFEADCSLPSPDLEISANAFIPCSVRTDKTPKRWNVLVWVLRWRSSIKRIVARKSRVRPI